MRVTWPSFSRGELIELLRTGVASLATELPVTRAVLFGSWATGRATASSDVDLLVIYSGPKREDDYKTVSRCVPVKGLEPHVYSEDEAASIADTLAGMTRKSIDVYPA